MNAKEAYALSAFNNEKEENLLDELNRRIEFAARAGRFYVVRFIPPAEGDAIEAYFKSHGYKVEREFPHLLMISWEDANKG